MPDKDSVHYTSEEPMVGDVVISSNPKSTAPRVVESIGENGRRIQVRFYDEAENMIGDRADT